MTELVSQIASINQAYLYNVWVGLGGNAKLVARATGIKEAVVEALAHDYGWRAMASGNLGLEDSELEKKINRATSYAQVQRFSKILDAAMDHLEEDPARLKQALFSTDKDGKLSINAKPLVEMAKAIETVHSIRYRALCDRLAEASGDSSGPEAAKSLSLTVIRELHNAIAAQPVPPEIVVDGVTP